MLSISCAEYSLFGGHFSQLQTTRPQSDENRPQCPIHCSFWSYSCCPCFDLKKQHGRRSLPDDNFIVRCTPRVFWVLYRLLKNAIGLPLHVIVSVTKVGTAFLQCRSGRLVNLGRTRTNESIWNWIKRLTRFPAQSFPTTRSLVDMILFYYDTLGSCKRRQVVPVNEQILRSVMVNSEQSKPVSLDYSWCKSLRYFL